MHYDSNGFKPYIYFFVFQNLSMCHTHTHIYIYIYIYYIGPMPKSVDYQFFGQFLKFLELSRQFSPDMSDLFPGHIQLAAHV
jgi:hypothetical protein